MKIVALDPISLFPKHIKALNKLGELVTYDTIPKDNDDILSRSKDADIVIDFWTAIPKEVIEKLGNVKMICSAASGYDWIDSKSATRRSITITHCPGHNSESVAEHTVGLMLAAMRLTRKASEEARNGKYTPEEYKGKELNGKIVGIIGYGSVGRRVGEIVMKGFGAKIVYVNSSSNRNDLEKLLNESDFISINAPLNDKTKNLISDKEFELMKYGVVFVNTGRGAIVDETALLKNLKSDKVFAAGLDILTKEPFDTANPLLSQDNVVVTPHIGWNTEETDYRLSSQIVDIVSAFIKGKPIHIIPEQR